MDKKTITIREAIRQVEENGTKVKVGNFESFDAFISYFDRYYKPLLKRLAEEWAMETDVRRFFTDDILSAFSEEVEEKSKEVEEEIDPTLLEALNYVRENLGEDDLTIIHAQISKNYKQHQSPATGIDDARVIDLFEEYGVDNDLSEGWWMEWGEIDDLLLML